MQAVCYAGAAGPKGPPSAPPTIPPIIINPFSREAPSPAIDPRILPPGPPLRPPARPGMRFDHSGSSDTSRRHSPTVSTLPRGELALLIRTNDMLASSSPAAAR